MSTAPANLAHRNVYGDPCLECEAECGQTCAPYCPESLGVEFFDAGSDQGAEDAWICPCGNNVFPGTGFALVDSHGHDMAADAAADPEFWNDEGEHYGCMECGRYGSQRNRLFDGRVQVLGQADTPPTGD